MTRFRISIEHRRPVAADDNSHCTLSRARCRQGKRAGISGRREGRLGMLRIRPVALSVCALLLGGAGGRAGAESVSYQGQIQFRTVAGDPCAATASEASYTINVYGRDDSSTQRIDGYLDGDKIVPAHMTGNNLGQLGVTYPGESSPSHVMRLSQLADGSFAGTFEAKTMVAALSGCDFMNARIKFTRTAVHTPEAYAQAARLFQTDSRAVQAYGQGLRGKVKDALPVL